MVHDLLRARAHRVLIGACNPTLATSQGHVGVSEVVKACPYAVFVGFLGYTGISLLVYAVQIADPGFTGITDAAGYATLTRAKTLEQVIPPIAVAVVR